MITQTLKLNLIPGQVLPRVNVSQYDAGTRTLQMLLYNGDQAFNISSGMSGFVQGTKPDRTGFQYAATVTEGSNVVTLVVTQQMAAVSGEVTCELVIANGNDRIATVNFILYVEPAALADDTVISDTELPLIEEAAELAQRIDGIVANVEADADRAETAADNAELWASRSPYIGQNGNWFVFDTTTGAYVDTQIPATGPQGPQGDDGPIGPTGPTGPTGNGIVSITKTGTSGLVDTYTILFTDGTTTTFTVTNGQDGQGSGDMTKAVYDSTNAVADAGGIVAYVAAHSGAGTLAGLDDVTLSSLAAGDTLVYNATTQKWENSTVIQTLTNQVKDMNNVYGSKNLLILTSYSKGETVSLNGGTIKCNEDGSYTINGTFTSDAALKIDWLVRADRREISNLRDKILIASCNGYNTSDIQFYTGCFKTDGTASQVGSGAYGETPRQYTMPSDAYTFRNWISIAAGTYSNVTIYPMVCLASVYELSPDWQSPSETNQQLTKDTTGLIDNQNVNGAVNMLPNNATTQTVNGITFTVNDDGSVTANGTSTGYTSLVIARHGEASFFDDFIGKPIKLSGCPSGGASNTYKLRFDYASGNYVDDVGEGVIITPTASNSNTWYVEIGISGGVTVSNLTFKPMITVPSYNGDYVLYAKSNKELTEELTVASGEITRLVSFSSLSAYTARKYGKVVELQFTGTLGEAVNAWTDFLTVPEGFRPSHYVQIVSFNTYNQCKNLQLAPTGGIQAAYNLSVNDFVRFTVTYIID